MEKKPVFEIHIEEWNHALHISGRDHKSKVRNLLYLCEKYKVNPAIYVLGDWIKENRETFEDLIHPEFNYITRSHGEHHYYDEKADRSPYWNQEGLPWPPSGGFFFRLLPLWYIRWAIEKSGVFWIHPHDLDEDHPELSNPWLNWKRHINLKGSKAKLERLLKEVDFGQPF